MNYRRCKCGKCESWESGMPPRDCQGCDECKTTFASGKSGHKPLMPHTLALRYSELTGEPSHYICTECLTQVELEKGD